jgi:hypothetical protein
MQVIPTGLIQTDPCFLLRLVHPGEMAFALDERG